MKPTLLAVAAAVVLAACATMSGPAPIPSATAKAPQLTTVTKLIGEAGLTETLSGAGPYTVFAPSDDAFKAMPPKALAALTSDKAALQALLRHHVVPGRVAAADVKPGEAATVQGGKVALAKAGSFVTVDEAVVIQADLPAANGVVHVIDRVLTPPKR